MVQFWPPPEEFERQRARMRAYFTDTARIFLMLMLAASVAMLLMGPQVWGRWESWLAEAGLCLVVAAGGALARTLLAGR